MYFVKQHLETISKTLYPLTAQPDFDDFWTETVRRAAGHNSEMEMRELTGIPIRKIRIFDMTQRALDGTLLKAWLYLPEEAVEDHPVPGVVFLHGGSGSR